MKRIYLASPTMHGDEQRFVQEAFDTNWVAPLGPNVNEFEKTMGEYLGEDMHAAALSAGTAALHMALKVLGIGEGDVVLATSLTFSASVNPITYVGATPVFVDSEYDTWNMDPKALRKAFEKYPNAKAVMLVHLYGTPAKIDEIKEICKEHNAILIEDAAEALSSTYKGHQCGTFGDAAALSFNGNKIITTSGGGMMVSHNEEYTKMATFLSTQARDPARHYQHSNIGYNYRMSNVVAGIGRGQMLHLEEHKALKKAIYKRYKEAFADIPEISMNPMNADGDANCWLSCIRIDPSASVTPYMVMDALQEKCNAETRPIWKPMHKQPVFEGCDYVTAGDKDVSWDIFEHGVCMPSDIKNTEEDMEMIIRTVRELFV